jgi:hypothetical protein
LWVIQDLKIKNLNKENVMSALFIFKQIKNALVNTSMPFVCVIIITLLTASCATAPTKQTASTDTKANSLTTKEKSDKETKENAIDKIECRDVTGTGSRFKRKVCEYKEVWAAIDKENSKNKDKLIKGINDQTGIINGPDAGNVNSVVSPMGGF